jgi:hypothetical protein
LAGLGLKVYTAFMNEHLRKYQHLSKLVAALPETISAARYIARFQEAVRNGDIAAVPLGSSFKAGCQTYKDDMVREGPEFETWHERTVRSLGVQRQRRGVAAHETDVLSGDVDFDDLAARYRQQLVGRASVKRPKQQTKRGKPKLTPSQPSERLASQPVPVGDGGSEVQAGGQGAPARAEGTDGTQSSVQDTPVIKGAASVSTAGA